MYVLSHMYLFPNVKHISSAKPFSLGNLPYWLICRNSFQSLIPLVL